VNDISRELRIIQRAMDRSRRAMNPGNYNPNGTVKAGARRWKFSRRYVKLRARKADAERCLASERKRSHGEDVNRTLALGDTFKLEKVSYRGWQKGFGRSVQRRAPGLYVSSMIRKAERAGGTVIEIDTRKTRLSQYCHRSGEYRKKRLSERWHVFPDGTSVQRDLYSAWLACFVHEDCLDTSLLDERWTGAEPLLRQAVSRHMQSASGRGCPWPSGGSPAGSAVGVDRLPKAEGRRPGRCSKRTRTGIEAGQALARGPHPRERSGEITHDTAGIPRL
jgi:putative transposase